MCLSPLLANPREDLSSVQLEEASLAVPRRMEDQVIETKLQIRSQLLDVLIRIAGDEPPAVCHVFHGRGKTLHLSRIVDARLSLSREREGGPDLGLLHGPVPICVERDLHLDHLVQLNRIAPRFLRSIAESRDQLL